MSVVSDKDIECDVESVLRVAQKLRSSDVGSYSGDAILIAASNIWLGQVRLAIAEELKK